MGACSVSGSDPRVSLSPPFTTHPFRPGNEQRTVANTPGATGSDSNTRVCTDSKCLHCSCQSFRCQGLRVDQKGQSWKSTALSLRRCKTPGRLGEFQKLPPSPHSAAAPLIGQK